MLAYIYSWFYPEVPVEPKKQCIYEKDLVNVRLKPTNSLLKPGLNPVLNPVLKPAPNFTLQSLNKEQLANILAVKLKKTNINPKKEYEPRHPVLKELLSKKSISI